MGIQRRGMDLCVSFFFQAEDGIRDLTVTGVQTCALPISFGGGGVGLNDGEGGSGKTGGYIGTCPGSAIAGDAGKGAGTATERARSALPVIWPQKHGPSFGAPVWPGCDWCKA